MSKLGSSIKDVGAKLSDVFTGAAEKVASFAVSMGKIGAVAGVAAVTYGVVGLNQQLETTQIGLATVFRMQGFSSNFQGGMVLAGETMAKLKQDVKSLPGDLGQLAGIFSTIAPAAGIAGASIDHMRKLAGETMAIGAVFGMDSQTASREMSMLLSGRAGAHNILGMKLGLSGDSAKSFNKLSAEKRLSKVDELMGPAQESIKAFGGSFTGLFTTLKDNLKYTLLGPATSPLFESVKAAMGKINAWFDTNKAQIAGWAAIIGTKLADAFDWAVAKVGEWWPAISTFAENAYNRLSQIWTDIEPTVKRVADYIKDMLTDRGTIDKLIKLGEVYVGIKGAQAIGGSVMSVGGNIGAMAMGGKALGLFGGGAGAAGGAAVAADGTGMGLAGLVATGAAAGAAALAIGGLGLAAWQAEGLYTEISTQHKQTTDALWARGQADLENIGKNDTAYDSVWSMARKLSLAGDESAASSLMASLNMRDLADAAARVNDGFSDINNTISEKVAKELGAAGEHAMLDLRGGGGDGSKPKKGAGGGGGGTHVNTINITVASNQDPNKIALAVFSKIQDVKRHPRSSGDAPNYSASVR